MYYIILNRVLIVDFGYHVILLLTLLVLAWNLKQTQRQHNELRNFVTLAKTKPTTGPYKTKWFYASNLYTK